MAYLKSSSFTVSWSNVTRFLLPLDSKRAGTPYAVVARLNACVIRFSRSSALIASKSNKEGLELM